MNSRLDRRVENVLLEAITSLQTDVQALKSQVQVVGPDSVVIKRVVSGATWDISAYSVAAFAQKSFRVVFTPTKMRNPAAEFFYTTSVTGGTGFEVFYYWPDTTNTSPTQRSWIFTIGNDSNNITLNVQFILKCADSGSITVTPI